MKKTIQQTIKTECFLVRLLFGTDTPRAILYWCLICVKYAMPLINVWIWKLILDELTLIYQTKITSTVRGNMPGYEERELALLPCARIQLFRWRYTATGSGQSENRCYLEHKV